jgi:hypothetical protein
MSPDCFFKYHIIYHGDGDGTKSSSWNAKCSDAHIASWIDRFGAGLFNVIIYQSNDLVEWGAHHSLNAIGTKGCD